LLAYSAITHVGYVLVSVSLFNINALEVFLIYAITYVLSTINVFAILSIFRKNNSFYKIRNIVELYILARSNSCLAFLVAIALLSSAGIPPLIGFFGKFFVFYSLLAENSFYLAGILILMSVATVVYYIRLIRFIFFGDSNIDHSAYAIEISGLNAFFLLIITLLNLFFMFYQTPLIILIHSLILNFLITLC